VEAEPRTTHRARSAAPVPALSDEADAVLSGPGPAAVPSLPTPPTDPLPAAVAAAAEAAAASLSPRQETAAEDPATASPSGQGETAPADEPVHEIQPDGGARTDPLASGCPAEGSVRDTAEGTRALPMSDPTDPVVALKDLVPAGEREEQPARSRRSGSPRVGTRLLWTIVVLQSVVILLLILVLLLRP
jgi:hypothetical protein